MGTLSKGHCHSRQSLRTDRRDSLLVTWTCNSIISSSPPWPTGYQSFRAKPAGWLRGQVTTDTEHGVTTLCARLGYRLTSSYLKGDVKRTYALTRWSTKLLFIYSKKTNYNPFINKDNMIVSVERIPLSTEAKGRDPPTER